MARKGIPHRLEFVVTYLEQRHKPPHTQFALPNEKIALLHAERPTVSFYRYLYDTVGEPWLWWERRALDDDALRAVITDDLVEIYVLYADGVPAGFAELDRRQEGAVDLAYFGMIPEFIGRGLGRYLLQGAVDIAWSYDIDKLTVNTCNYDHPKALQTYQRAGFAVIEQRRKMVDDPRDTGLIPRSVRHPNDDH